MAAKTMPTVVQIAATTETDTSGDDRTVLHGLAADGTVWRFYEGEERSGWRRVHMETL